MIAVLNLGDSSKAAEILIFEKLVYEKFPFMTIICLVTPSPTVIYNITFKYTHIEI